MDFIRNYQAFSACKDKEMSKDLFTCKKSIK